MEETLEKLASPEISPIKDADIIAYLRRSYKFAEIAALAERDALVLNTCEQLGITVSDEELQAAGDAFRLEYKLLGGSETFAWLSQQRITVEDWSQGIRVALLTKKLQEHLFGAAVDSQYVSNRNNFKRVALSQILVLDLTEGLKIAQALREENASLCALALEYSKGKQSRENGGFVGIQFLAELVQEVAEAVAKAKEGEVIGPVQTKFGYHILRVEKWFPPQLNESVRERVLESFFQAWLQQLSHFNYRT
ncbi:peptidylprolyl isomerase [Mastigocladopsis repens]|uniref:peptidylprolyl isomerase n=1 Tax=Mastigocladopsis repens TaxID=221287 RepID=UPI000306F9DB|nr:peptidylprolyl isomerase [Mastigocladopsis repens]